MIKRITILFFFGLFLFNARSVFASSCSQYGNTTYCSDGTSYSQYGNTTYGSDGTSYSQYGNTLYGSDGTSYSQYGNTTYGSGNTYNSCPANSSYDSLSGKCKCEQAYKVSGSSCVYDYSYATASTCPINSYYDGVSSCKCNYGYIANGGSCVTYNQSCQNKYGYNTYGDSSSCYCSAGYQWNTPKTLCVWIPPAATCSAGSVYKNNQCISNTEDCRLSFGDNIVGTPGLNGNSSCNCASGYQWNGLRTACQIDTALPASGLSTESASFTSSLQIGSSGAQVTLLQTLLKRLGNFSGEISGYYGGVTKAAVIKYQISRNLSMTGTVGPKTRASLNVDLLSK